jgi:hypothetical protein
MDAHRVRRLSGALLASELRSGRSLSDPRSLLGQPIVLAFIDVGAFVLMFALVSLGLRALGPSVPGAVQTLSVQLLALLPILSVGAVLVAGVMFEFSTGSRFAASDAANWLPVTPTEYVVASSLAVSWVYSPAVAFILGIAGALAAALDLLPAFLLTAGLSVLALFEGGVLIEVLRAVTQRAASALSGRKGRVTLALRAGLLVIVILVFELAFNPLLLEGVLGAVAGVEAVSAVVPLFWATRAVAAFLAGDPLAAVAFALAQLAFVGVLLYAAAWVRVRLWAPAAPEVELAAHAFGGGHRTLSHLGLSSVESALVWKDLVGLVRRREMLPIVVTPLVLALVGFLQPGASGAPGGGFDRMSMALWAAWVSGFFALMLSTTSLGQERRSVHTLFSFPISGRDLFRAKVVETCVLAAVLGAGLDAAVAVVAALPALAVATVAVVTAAAIAAGTFVGLTIATRYSDFQERPRPQFVRPWAMVVGMLGGIGVIFGMVLPSLAWSLAPDPFAPGAWGLALMGVAVAVVTVPVFFVLARRGAARFLDELPT